MSGRSWIEQWSRHEIRPIATGNPGPTRRMTDEQRQQFNDQFDAALTTGPKEPKLP